MRQVLPDEGLWVVELKDTPNRVYPNVKVGMRLLSRDAVLQLEV